MKKSEKDSHRKLLTKIRDRYTIMTEADQTNRSEALEDLKFVNVPGAQWEANMKLDRGNRPCYEFNKLRINGKKVINEIRANRPQGKVRAVEGGDKDIAEIYEGLIRNIWNVSDGDTLVDQAAEYQVDAGMGCWRVTTEYSDDTAFDQDILLKPIKNPFCLYADPACQDVMKRDAEDWILTEKITNKAYEAKYGKVEKVDFEDAEFDDEEDWQDDETVRICEYWYKEPYDKEIWLIEVPNEDGTTNKITVDSTSDEGQALLKLGVQPIKTRTAKCHKVMMCIVSGKAVLEGPVEWAGAEFPFVLVYGEYKIVDGVQKWWGLHRFAKDAQRSYNTARTAIDETIAQAPKAQWWATSKQALGHTDQWDEAHRKNFPWMMYEADPAAPGPPQRMGGVDVPVALLSQAEVSAQDIRDVTGLHEASFGEEGNEKSGVALARRQSQAQVVTYNFPDNMAKGIRRTWEILIDLIPEIYDAERELRIIGADGAEDYKRVNQIVTDPETLQNIRVNDLSAGKYDVVITVGPNYGTLRQEAAEVWTELVAKFPDVMGVAGDLIFKSFDLPYADEIGERMQTLLPPQIQQQMAEGKEMPPEVQAAMAQADQAMQLVQEQTQLVQAAAQEVEQSKAESDKAKAEVNTAIANLKTEEARFEAKVAKALAGIAQKEAQFAQMQTGQDFDQERGKERDSLSKEVNEAITTIQQAVADFQQQALATLADIMAKQQTQVNIPQSRKVTRIRAKRVNGELEAVPEYEEAAAAL